MACINVSEVQVQNNPATFFQPLAFDIQYECLTELEADLEWKMIYVGSAESEEYDQVLDSILVGPVYAGNYRFVFEANPPDPARLQPDDVVGVTVILLTCSYKVGQASRVKRSWACVLWGAELGQLGLNNTFCIVLTILALFMKA
jgi:histone chaperone ASF1